MTTSTYSVITSTLTKTADTTVLNVSIGPKATSNMPAFATNQFSIEAPSADDLANYNPGKNVSVTYAPAADDPAPAATGATGPSASSGATGATGTSS